MKMEKENYKIVFLGTPEFAVPFLAALAKSEFKPILVITQPDEPVGRRQQMQPPPVKVAALELGLEIAQPKDQKELGDVLKKTKPDLCILVAFGEMIKKEILAVPKFGFVNIHPSLLPKHRGSSPVQTAILNGDKITGVSIMLLDEQMDHGPIIVQQELEILDRDNNATLHQRLAEIGSPLLIKTLPDYLSGKIKLKPQDESKATFTRMIGRQNGQVIWANTAEEIGRQFKAFYPWPGVFTNWAGKRLKIADLSVLEGNLGARLSPGTVFLLPDGGLAVSCGQGAVALNKVQISGKKETAGKDFARGYPKIVNSILN